MLCLLLPCMLPCLLLLPGLLAVGVLPAVYTYCCQLRQQPLVSAGVHHHAAAFLPASGSAVVLLSTHILLPRLLLLHLLLLHLLLLHLLLPCLLLAAALPAAHLYSAVHTHCCHFRQQSPVFVVALLLAAAHAAALLPAADHLSAVAPAVALVAVAFSLALLSPVAALPCSAWYPSACAADALLSSVVPAVFVVAAFSLALLLPLPETPALLLNAPASNACCIFCILFPVTAPAVPCSACGAVPVCLCATVGVGASSCVPVFLL